jgi:hypothetical protein
VRGGRTFWDRLGIAKTDDPAEIRRAYARALKAIDPEADPDSFIALRQARDWALAHAAHALAVPEPDEEEEDEDEEEEEVGAEWRDDWAGYDEIGVAGFGEREPGRDAGGEPLPWPDSALLERLDALLFSPGDPAAPDEIADLTRTILADPAIQRLEVATWIEDWMTDRIVRAMPRSDPMIEPAAEHFRWGKDKNELSRPPVVDYILQRVEDRLFESDLETNSRRYHRLLERLRRPLPSRPNPLAAWWLGPRVEYLIAYLQTYRPTVLRGLDQDTLGYWYEQIDAQSQRWTPWRWLRTGRRNVAWNRGLFGPSNQGDPGREEQGLGYVGLAIVLLLSLSRLGLFGSSTPPESPPMLPHLVAAYADADADLDPIIRRASLSLAGAATLKESNPRLYDRLVQRWEEARDARENSYAFQVAIEAKIDEAYIEWVRNGSYEEQADYWKLIADRAREARKSSAEACDSALRGEPGAKMPPRLELEAQALMAQALLTPAKERPTPRAASSTFAIPQRIAEDTLKRSHLAPERLKEALRDRGTAADRCAARIALIDSALAQPKAVAAPFLRHMSAPL